MKANKRILLLLAPALLSTCLVGCNTGGPGGDTGPGTTSQSGTESTNPISTDTGTTGGGGGSTTSSEEEIIEDVEYSGKLRIWYHRDDMSYDALTIYLWNQAVDGEEYEWSGSDDTFGVYFDIDLSASEQFKDAPSTDIRMIVKYRGTWNGQSQDTFCSFNRFSVVDDVMNIYACAAENGVIETYKLKEDALGDRIEKCYVGADWKTIYVTGTGTPNGRPDKDVGKAERYEVYRFDRSYYQLKEDERYEAKPRYKILEGTATTNNFSIPLGDKYVLSDAYEVDVFFALNPSKAKTKLANVRGLYDTDTFKKDYTYTGKDLGVTFNQDGSRTFKLWAPTSARVQIRFYQSGTPKSLGGSGLANYPTSYDMELGEKGVWSFTEKEDEVGSSVFRRKFYTYNVTNANGTSETIDPYAKAAGVNGIRGAMVDFDKDENVVVEGFDQVDEKLPAIKGSNNLTVYEAHIRDLTADKSWSSNKNNVRGGYNAFCEEGTTYTSNGKNVATGFDHIKELGVNAIQLLPVFDQDNDERTDTVYTDSKSEGGILNPASYNWGYNPLNYNIVEGAYSSNPLNQYTRIREFRNLVTVAANNGIRIIMDVVYNHMASVNNNAFNKIVPQYYFRTNANGDYTDGSGCGNEIASDRPMMSKYIAESVAFWAKTYKIKGFRFDLMGCIDTDTMKAVRAAVNEIDPTIVLYGEGWTGGGTALDGGKQSSTNNVYAQLNTSATFPVGCFNDAGRDGSKGNTAYGNVIPASGWICEGSNVDNVYNSLTQILGENRNAKRALGESTFKMNPNQTVNYLACHDNYTLYDQINWHFYKHDSTFDDPNHEYVMKAAAGLTALSLMGQGIGFINGGDELFRQKLIDKTDYWFEDLRDSYKFGRYEEYKQGDGSWKGTSFSRSRTEGAWDNFQIGDRYYDGSGNQIYQGQGESWDSFMNRASMKRSDWIEGDGIEISANKWLVRNSYKYGDAVNAFRWDRKTDATVLKHYNHIKDAVALRNAEMGNTLGQTYAQVANDGTTCWNYNDLFDGDGNPVTDLIAGHFKGQSDGGKATYIFVNKGNGAASIGIGSGRMEVLYSSTGDHRAGDVIEIPDSGEGAYKITAQKFECLIVRQIG